jgi:AcrR family transcriptional regulator
MATGTEVRGEILMAAGPIFAEVGFARATVREICGAAGVNVAAVNYYFGDKQRLYVETVKHAYQLRSTQVPMPAWSGDESPEEMLRGFLAALARRMLGEDQGWTQQLLLREVLNPTSACKTLVEDFFRPQMDFVMDVLAKLLPSDVSMVRRRKVAFSVFGQCLFYRVAGEAVKLLVSDEERQSHFGIEDIASHIADLILSSIQPCPDSWRTETDTPAGLSCHTASKEHG